MLCAEAYCDILQEAGVSDPNMAVIYDNWTFERGGCHRLKTL